MTKTVDEIAGAGEIIRPDRLTREDKLERWAAALERRKGSRLGTLRETEFMAPRHRHQLRADNTPLTVAFDEPVLRSAGLRDDTFGEAARFFELSDWELHSILCYCHFGEQVSAADSAQRVRAIQRRDSLLAGELRSMTLGRGVLLGSVAAAGLAWAILAI
ncbi:MAG TPA: hypothetical protein VHG92_14445 [Afifellaceae bacterium]|nr:hypothetical protein [Afifellaceae bacterium]